MAACQSEPDYVIVMNEAGQVIERYQVKDDSIRHGLSYRYSGDNVVMEEANYQDGQLNGQRTLYFKDGNREIVQNYINGRLEGVVSSYYPSGELQLELPYHANVIVGKSKKYYKSGALMEEVLFADNEERGSFVEYHENGNKKWEGQYLNGPNEVDTLRNYSEDGQLLKMMYCDSFAICQTIWTPEKGYIAYRKIEVTNNAEE